MADPYAKRSSREENERIEYAAPCIQGPHVGMEDYHTAILELDGSDSTSFFGVFDGHGGAEIASYCSKRYSGEENDRIKYDASCMKGCRDAMQDDHATILELDGSDSTSLFGDFDGHLDGGDKVALYCSKQFHAELVKAPDHDDNLPTTMQNFYLRTDQALERSEKRKKSDSSPDPVKGNLLSGHKTGVRDVSGVLKNYKALQNNGSTARVALIRGNQTTVGNAGDSFCVLSRNGQEIDLSTDHKPNYPGKRDRIEAAGGKEPLKEIPKFESEPFFMTLPHMQRITKMSSWKYMTYKTRAETGGGSPKAPPAPSSNFCTKRKLGGLFYGFRHSYSSCHWNTTKNNKRSFGTQASFKEERRSEMNDENAPSDEDFERLRNTVTLCLDGTDEEVLQSYLAALTHIRLWNAGDSFCVLTRNGQEIDLSTDHKPNYPGKRDRIEAAGGKEPLKEIPKFESEPFFMTIPHMQRITKMSSWKYMTRKTRAETGGGSPKTPPAPRAKKASSNFCTKRKLGGSFYGFRHSYSSCHWNTTKNNKRSFGTQASFKEERRSEMNDENAPSDEDLERLRNTVTLCLDGTDEEVLRSYLAALTHIRLWNAQNGTEISFESILGYRSKVYATPLEGTFYLVITYKGRSVTLVIDARTGWLYGYIGPKGIFQFKKSATAPMGTPDYIMHIIAHILSTDGSYDSIAPNADVSMIEVGTKPLRASHVKLAEFNGGEEDLEFRLSFGVFVFGILEAFKSHVVAGLVSSAIRDGTTTTICKSSKPDSAKIVKNWGKGSSEANDALFLFLKYGTRRNPPLLKNPCEDMVTVDDYVKNTLICPNWSALRHAFRVAPTKANLSWSPVDDGDGDHSVSLLNEYDKSGLSAEKIIAFDKQNAHFFGCRAGGLLHSSVSSLTGAIMSPAYHLPWWDKLPVKVYRRLPTDQQLRGERSAFFGSRVKNFQQRRYLHSHGRTLDIARRALNLLRK